MEEKQKNKKSRKVPIILGLILAVIVSTVAVFSYTQRENIGAVIKAQNTSKEDIAQEIAVSKEKTQKEIEKYNIPITRDFTLEEEEEIRRGDLTVEEAVKRLMTPSVDNSVQSGGVSSDGSRTEVSDSGQSQGQSSVNKSGAEGTQSSEAAQGEALTQEQQVVAKYLTEMYSLKAYYIGQLGTLESSLKSEYKQKFGTNKNPASIAKFIQSNMSRAIKMESECDSKVYSILDNMRSELNDLGADTTIVQVAEDAYIKEKSLRKSYYLSLYK